MSFDREQANRMLATWYVQEGGTAIVESAAEVARSLKDALAEIDRLHAERSAGRQHVEQVVKDIALQEIKRSFFPFANDARISSASRKVAEEISSRVADRLIVPVLSDEDRDRLAYLVGWCNASIGDVTLERPRLDYAIEALDRLIAAGKP